MTATNFGDLLARSLTRLLTQLAAFLGARNYLTFMPFLFPSEGDGRLRQADKLRGLRIDSFKCRNRETEYKTESRIEPLQTRRPPICLVLVRIDMTDLASSKIETLSQGTSMETFNFKICCLCEQ